MQFNTICWEGGIGLSLKGLNGWASPQRTTQEYEFDDSSDEAVAEVIVDVQWEVLGTDRTLNPTLARVWAGQGNDL